MNLKIGFSAKGSYEYILQAVGIDRYPQPQTFIKKENKFKSRYQLNYFVYIMVAMFASREYFSDVKANFYHLHTETRLQINK